MMDKWLKNVTYKNKKFEVKENTMFRYNEINIIIFMYTMLIDIFVVYFIIY